MPSFKEPTLNYSFVGGQISFDARNQFYGWSIDVRLYSEYLNQKNVLDSFNELESVKYLSNVKVLIDNPFQKCLEKDPSGLTSNLCTYFMDYTILATQKFQTIILAYYVDPIGASNYLYVTTPDGPIEFLEEDQKIEKVAFQYPKVVGIDKRQDITSKSIQFLQDYDNMETYLCLVFLGNKSTIVISEDSNQVISISREEFETPIEQSTIVKTTKATNQSTRYVIFIQGSLISFYSVDFINTKRPLKLAFSLDCTAFSST